MKQRHHFANKGLYSQSYVFSSSCVQMWELDHKQEWVPKNWCFQTVVLEKIPKSPLESKEIKPVNSKGNQPWIFTGRTDAEVVNTSATWCQELAHWKRNWFLERLRGRGKGGDWRWDSWMASPTQWTWDWANLGNSEGQGSKHGMLPSMGSQSWIQLSNSTTMYILSEHCHAFFYHGTYCCKIIVCLSTSSSGL